jgi:hypothetical protein
MLRCTVEGCEGGGKNLSGLASHVRNNHPEIDWQEYKQKLQPALLKQEPQAEQLTEDTVKRIAKEVVSMMQNPAEPQLEKPFPKGFTPLPMEEVEVAGDRINIKVALNPLIYSRLMKFKAANLDLAKNDQRIKVFSGDLGDFIDLATKTLLNVYGIYPDVSLRLRGGNLLIELPQELREMETESRTNP